MSTTIPRPPRSLAARAALAVALALPVLVAKTPAAGAGGVEDWPRGEVFEPKHLFGSKDNPRKELDERVLNANPRLYIYPDFEPAEKKKILVIGMPGWGGRSENFIWTLINGLKREGLSRQLVVAAIQDTQNGGPRYQGQGSREHANVWELERDGILALRRFIARIANQVGLLEVYFFGYSTGSMAGPIIASRVAQWNPDDRYLVKGTVAVGTGSPISASRLNDKKQRILFLVVPEKRPDDGPALRYDQNNRRRAELMMKRLEKNGAEVFLRSIESARRHVDWHWGLLSQCRYFRTERIDPGRGYWPHYWMPNPETYRYVVDFVQGKEPPPPSSQLPEQKCPH